MLIWEDLYSLDCGLGFLKQKSYINLFVVLCPVAECQSVDVSIAIACGVAARHSISELCGLLKHFVHMVLPQEAAYTVSSIGKSLNKLLSN